MSVKRPRIGIINENVMGNTKKETKKQVRERLYNIVISIIIINVSVNITDGDIKGTGWVRLHPNRV